MWMYTCRPQLEYLHIQARLDFYYHNLSPQGQKGNKFVSKMRSKALNTWRVLSAATCVYWDLHSHTHTQLGGDTTEESASSPFSMFVYVAINPWQPVLVTSYYDWLAVWTSAHNLRHLGNKFSKAFARRVTQRRPSFMLVSTHISVTAGNADMVANIA